MQRGEEFRHPTDLYMDASIQSKNHYGTTTVGAAVRASDQGVSKELASGIHMSMHATGDTLSMKEHEAGKSASVKNLLKRS